ncbi:hypothetical protein D3C86_882650 [compost metagenome]
MAWASSCSPRNTFASVSAASRRASCSLWLRTTVWMVGFSVRAVSIIWRTFMASGVATTSTRARATCAWISTAGSAASPHTAGMPASRSFSTSSRFCSATT